MDALFYLIDLLPLWARQGHVLFGVAVLVAVRAVWEGGR